MVRVLDLKSSDVRVVSEGGLGVGSIWDAGEERETCPLVRALDLKSSDPVFK